MGLISIKRCPSCEQTLPIDAFAPRKRGGVQAWCRACCAQRAKEWRTENPADHRDRMMRSKYGITVAEYDDMLAAQGGVCAVCGNPESRRTGAGAIRRLSVDHDHACCPGRRACGDCIRGLLCHDCNAAEGLLKTADVALRMAQYMRCATTPSASGVV